MARGAASSTRAPPEWSAGSTSGYRRASLRQAPAGPDLDQRPLREGSREVRRGPPPRRIPRGRDRRPRVAAPGRRVRTGRGPGEDGADGQFRGADLHLAPEIARSERRARRARIRAMTVDRALGEAILAQVDARDLVDLAGALIRIPSFKTEETAVARFLEGFFRSRGYVV